MPKTSKGFWKSFFVLAVEKTIEAEKITSFLDSVSISNYIYAQSPSYGYEQEKLPFALSYTQSEMLFSDKTGEYQLFYIPIQYLNLFSEKSFVEHIPFQYILDTQLKKNLILSIFSFVLFFILLSKTKQKVFFFFASFPLVISAFFYTQFLFIVLFLSLFYLLFLISLSYKRSNFFHFFIKNKISVLISLLYFISFFLGDFIFFFQSLTISMLCFSSLGIYCIFEKIIDSKRRFTPRYILSSTQKKEAAYTSVLTFMPFSMGLLLFFMLSSLNLNFQIQNNVLQIPSPLQSSQKNQFTLENYEKAMLKHSNKQKEFFLFPNLTFFLSDTWNFTKYPYVSVYDEDFYNQDYVHIAQRNDTVQFTRFVRDEEGIIQLENQLYIFDNSFIASILERITDGISVEYLLQSQNCFTEIRYEKTTKPVAENFLQLKLFFSCVFSLFLITLLFIEKRKQVL